MPRPNTENNVSLYDKFIELMKINIRLSLSKAILVIPTQPLQVVMRFQQASLADKQNPRLLPAIIAAKKIYSQNSSAAFFRGVGPGMLKEALKNTVYKGACITGAPGLAEQCLPTSSNLSSAQYYILRTTIAGVIAGGSDTILGGFLEGWATYRTTSQGEYQNKSFWQEVIATNSFTNKIKRMYRGAGANFIKSTIAFTTYFAVGNYIEKGIINVYGKSNYSQLPWEGRLLSAVITGGAVAIASSPFDIVKTQYQMPNPNKETLSKALYNNYKRFGTGGISAGLPLKFGMITAGWAVNRLATQPKPPKHIEKRIINPVNMRK